MSTISRRDFMKTAGVMTLAVAASGVLAGCSTEDAASKATEVTATSATVGNYTYSIVGAKVFGVKNFDTNDIDASTGSAKALIDDRKVVVVYNVKKNDADKPAGPTAWFVTIPVNATPADKNVKEDYIKKAFGVSAISAMPKKIKSFTNATKDGTYYYEVYDVTPTNAYTDDKSFKTPSFNAYVGGTDEKGKTLNLAQLVVDVPSTVTYEKAADLY